MKHRHTREQDEIACTCGLRWGVKEEDPHVAPLTPEDIQLWQESTPADYAEWTIADCDMFLTAMLERL